MKRIRSVLLTLAAGVSLLASAVTGLQAQGVTTSAVGGSIWNGAGQPVAGAQVTVRNPSTGFSRTVTTNGEGRFYVPNLLPGGPYTVTAQGLNLAPQTREGVVLVLNQTTSLDFTLTDQAIAISGLTVTAQSNPVLSTNKTGASTVVSGQTLESTPTLNRNFTDLATISPHVTASGDAPSVGGANNRFNNIQIDGASSSDIFGLGSTGTPGGQGTPARPVPLDAIDQFQILVTPFDIRQAGFTGGLINAVTKAGTNTFRGSAFINYRNQSFVNRDSLQGYGRSFAPPTDFLDRQFGATLSGPIIKDRLFYMVSGEVDQRSRPENFSAASDPSTIHILPSRIDQIADIATNSYGLNPGSGALLTDKSDQGTFVGRLDWRINDDNRLVFRQNYTPKWHDDAGISRGGSNFDFTSYNYYYKTTNLSSVVQLFSQLGQSLSNELLVNYEDISDRPLPEVRFGLLNVKTADSIGGRIQTQNVRLGAEVARQANELDQHIFELTDNLTYETGAHRVTVGTNTQYLGFRNLFNQGALGQWTFDTPEDFAAGAASRFTVSVPLRPDIAARFAVLQPSVYAQDEWSVGHNLTLTGGLRLDVPFFLDDPAHNDEFQAAFGADNSTMPSGNVLFSPRVAFNWQSDAEMVTQLRGGVGLFTGRPPFVWLSNSYGNTGKDVVTVSCNGANTPVFTGEAAFTPPTACRDGSGAQSAQMSVNYVDPDFKYPQDLKASIGVDQALPYGMTGTLEYIFTRGMNTTVAEEVNLAGAVSVPASATQGLGDRVIYGTPQEDRDYLFSPVRKNDAFRHTVLLTNAGASRTDVVVAQLAKRFGDRYTVQASYSWINSNDPISLTSSVATSNVGFHPIGRTINDFTLAPSAFERSNKITFVGTARPFPKLGTEISAIYIGQSGRTYSYVYNGDVNGDGYPSSDPGIGGRNNDLVYIPANPDEIDFRNDLDRQLFEELIGKEKCLQDQKGQIMARNSCRGPWTNRLDARLTQDIAPKRFANLQLELNVFNFLNLLNSDWGLQQGPSNNTVNLLSVEGRADPEDPNSAPVLSYAGFTSADRQHAELPYTTFDPDSRYQIQLGLRYRF